MGPELMAKFREQAERFGAEVVDEDAVSVDFDTKPYTISTDRQSWQAHSVIVATGASALWLGLPSEERLRGRGVSTCATCDGFFFRGKRVAVIGGGNTAVEEALYMTNHSHDVTIIHRRDAFRAEKILQDRLHAHPNIKVRWDSVVDNFVGGGSPEGLVGLDIRNVQTGIVERVPFDGAFVAIGHHPATELFADSLELDDDGYIKVEAGTTRTSVPGVFASGDVADKIYRQAVTAAGTGCMAALDAERYLATLEFARNEAVAAAE